MAGAAPAPNPQYHGEAHGHALASAHPEGRQWKCPHKQGPPCLPLTHTLGPLEGSPGHQCPPGPPRGWAAANMHWRPSPDKAPHTDPAKGPGSSLLIAILASELTGGKTEEAFFLAVNAAHTAARPIHHRWPPLTAVNSPGQVPALLLLLNIFHNLLPSKQDPLASLVRSGKATSTEHTGPQRRTGACHTCKLQVFHLGTITVET